nr:transcription termination factor Rho [Lachnospiraceae bacterium]
PAKKAAAEKAPAKKAAAEKAPAKKAPAEKAAAEKASAKKAPAEKAAAEKASAKKAPAEKAVAEKSSAKKAPAEKAVAEKASVKKAPAEKAPEGKVPAKKTEPAKKQISKKESDGEKKGAVKAEPEKNQATQEVKTVPVRSFDSQVTTRETVSPRQATIRRDGNAPVRRPAQGTRQTSSTEQKNMPVNRPVNNSQVGRTVQNDQKNAQPVRPVQERRPAAPQQQTYDRSQGGQYENPVQNHADTLASYIAQNYALAGSPQDSGETKEGILEVMNEGFAFVRCDNFLPGSEDVYVSPAQIKRFGLKTGDYIVGNTKVRMPNEKFSALLYINTVNKLTLDEVVKRKKFEELTPIFPNQRFHLETQGCGPAMRMVDLLSPIGKGQRGMIVSQPKAGKTTLLKQIAKALIKNHPSIHLIILLIDERPEEVTDMKESISGDNVEVIYSTFDEQPENHKRVSEMVIERARRLVEQQQDVVILLDSITRLARAYNLTVQASGRTLSGGLDPAALYMPKKFFGAARCMREGGSLTVLATALVDTGSRMDDVVFEEFKGTGNMELVLDRNLSERRVFPAIDLPKSGTRREDLLLTPQELEASNIIRRAFNSSRTDEVVEKIINLFTHTRNNKEFVEVIKKTRIVP